MDETLTASAEAGAAWELAETHRRNGESPVSLTEVVMMGVVLFLVSRKVRENGFDCGGDNGGRSEREWKVLS